MIYEIKKVFGKKSVAVFLLALLLLGIGVCFFTNDTLESEGYRYTSKGFVNLHGLSFANYIRYVR